MMPFGENLIGLQRYAMHVESGRCVLAVPATDRSIAIRLFQTLAQYGAYDVVYFGAWTVEYAGPTRKVEHELPV